MSKHVINVANALITLRSTSSMQVAEIAGVNHENLRHFLNGANVPIKHDTVRSAFAALGVVGGKLGKIIHNWTISGGVFKHRDDVYASLTTAATIIRGGKLTEIKTKGNNKSTAYLLSADSGARVVIMDNHGLLRKSKVAEYLGMEVVAHVNVVPQVWAMVVAHDLSMTEFEMVTEGDGALNGWKQVRIVAREYGVSPKEIVAWAMAQRGEKQTKEFKLELVVNNKATPAEPKEVDKPTTGSGDFEQDMNAVATAAVDEITYVGKGANVGRGQKRANGA